MGTYVARNAGSVKVGDYMIFDEDAGEEKVVMVQKEFVGKQIWPCLVRIGGKSGREIRAFETDHVVLAVDEPVYEEDRARDAYFANRSQGK